jgi:hypothetical protein
VALGVIANNLCVEWAARILCRNEGEVQVARADDLDNAFAARIRERAEALYVRVTP